MKPPTRATDASVYATPVRGKKGRACPTCGARPGWPCVKWKTDKGEQLYVIGPMIKFHKER